MNPHSAALPRTARPLWLLVLLSLLTWLAACSDSPPPAPVISVQPSDASAVAGTAATLSVTASGPDIAYQWQLSNDGGTTWANVAGATQASYATPPTTLADSGKRYRVVVSAAGISVNSSAVQLTVTAAVVVPTLTVQPAAQSATAPDPATFSVTASGTSPSYQWQRSTDSGATFTNITGATAASYSTGATATTMSGERFRVVVTNSAGSVTSSAVVLSVNPAPVAAAFTAQPANQSVTAGSAAAFTVVATGTPPPTLQWQRSTDAGSTFNNISGATDPTYNTGLTTLSQNGERYRVLASNSAGSATSSTATLTVNAAPQAPVITTQPTAQSVTAPATATFTAAASGVPTPTWQWQLSTDNAASFANITGATNPSYTTPATVVGDNGKRFRVVATNSAGPATSQAAVLTVTGAASLSRFAYVANFNDNTVSMYTVNPANGQLGVVGSVATGTGPRSIAVDPLGRFAYVANLSSNNVSAYTVNPITGALTSVGTVPVGTGPRFVTVDPLGKFVYVTNQLSNNISAFNINASTGALTSVAGSPFAAPSSSVPYAVTVDFAGRFAYVTNAGFSSSVSAYSIDASTGALAIVGTVPTGFDPRSVTIDPTGKFAYVANIASSNVSVYSIDGATGALTSLATTPAGTDAYSVVVDPSGRFAYVANVTANTISAYSINASTGLLTSLGAAVPTGINPYSITVDASGTFVYTAHLSSNDVGIYSINASTGALTSVGTVSAGSGPSSITLSKGP